MAKDATRESASGFVSDLRSLGHAVLPAPRKVKLDGGRIDGTPVLSPPQLSGVDENDIAVRTLLDAMGASCDAPGAGGSGATEKGRGDQGRHAEQPRLKVKLAIEPGAVATGTSDGRDAQAYRLEIAPEAVALTANGRPGLFYGVQTLIQLVHSPARGLPTGVIVDWPEYELRCIHWDTKHHQDRPETLRRFLDQAARFKINAILFELEDKFAYPTHPVIGAPGAFTTEQLQSLVDYALERHIQIIPDVQSPAHLCYVLKHEEFAHLRCDDSNYQACMDEPEARRLLFDMYDDVCAATKGADYFHVSTDEVYYAGICEKFRKPYNPENRSLTWVDYVNAAYKHLSEKWGRKVLVWVEFPLLPEHLRLLPRELLNGIGGRKPEHVRAENELGVRQFCYVPMQGSELLFPNYLTWVDAEGAVQRGRCESAAEDIAAGKTIMPNAIGTISAAWDDSGLHNESFWLGWAMTGQAAWTPGLTVEEAAAAFFALFYGAGAEPMSEIYRDLQLGARYVERSLERLPSKVRGPGYGYHDRKTPVERHDRTLIAPALPSAGDLSVEPVFRTRYERALAEAPAELMRNDHLLLRLQTALQSVRRNRYNLEVFLSIARLQRQVIETLLGLAASEDFLVAASGAARDGQPERAVNLLVDARNRVRRLVDALYGTYGRVKATWEKARFEKGRSLDGRHFVHVMDTVKDHLADRRPDLTYLIEWFELIDLAGWLKQLRDATVAYAAAHGVALAASAERELNE